MQLMLRVVLVGASLCMTAASSDSARPAGPHLVTVHIESLTGQPTSVHVWADTIGIWQPGDTTYRREITVSTPNDVMIGPRVMNFELRTDSRKVVKAQFTDGATDAEKALHPWGWLMAFRRVNGDFQPEAKVVPAQP